MMVDDVRDAGGLLIRYGFLRVGADGVEREIALTDEPFPTLPDLRPEDVFRAVIRGRNSDGKRAIHTLLLTNMGVVIPTATGPEALPILSRSRQRPSPPPPSTRGPLLHVTVIVLTRPWADPEYRVCANIGGDGWKQWCDSPLGPIFAAIHARCQLPWESRVKGEP